jgi:RNA polymerase sigma-70 factor (ECF subfamily)
MSDSAHKKRRRPSSAELSRWFHSACRQEAGALQQLLALYRPLLMKLAHQRLKGALRTKVAPSDLVQTTVWKATQNFGAEQFAGRSGFLAWLVTILKNEATDARRRYRVAKKRDVSRERPLFSAETQNWLNQLSASLSVSDAVLSERHETVEHLLAALQRLPPHYQLVLRLRFFDKLDFGAIGEKLERTCDAARVLNKRALKRLRRELTLLSNEDSVAEE